MGAAPRSPSTNARRRLGSSRVGRGAIALPALVVVLLAVLGILAPRSSSAAAWLTISEIAYRPPEGPELEFVEILLLNAPRAEIGGWRLDGEIEFTFPPGTAIAPGERLVVAASPERLAASVEGLDRVLGPFRGRLDNRGGEVIIRNRVGAVVCAARYGREGPWTSVPDGTGHTLVLRDPLFDPRRPESWTASPRVGGSPGRADAAPDDGTRRALLDDGPWRFLRGRREPDAAWIRPSFDDGGWERGALSIGFGDGDDRTVLDDMRHEYVSVYLRRRFSVDDPKLIGELVLEVDFDDGHVCYLNGVEVARENLGFSGELAAHDRVADRAREAGAPARYLLGRGADILWQGENVLAVQVHNALIDSSDLSLDVELVERVAASSLPRAPRIDEVLIVGDTPSAESFVEIAASPDRPVDLSGWHLTDDRGALSKHRLPVGSVVPAGGRLVVRGDVAGLSFPGRKAFVALVDPSARVVVDAARLALHGEESGVDGQRRRGHFAHLEGEGAELRPVDRPSPGTPSEASAPFPIVISELHYHPPLDDPSQEFVELSRASGGVTSLAGMRLEGDVSYTFPSSAEVAPDRPIVVARDPDALRARYGLPVGVVLGPFSGRLSNAGATLRLVDGSGRVVDEVRWGDRHPWPRWADGLGATLELRHLGLDNSIPSSWAASDDRDKARWGVFRYRGEHRAFGGRSLSELQILLLNDGECLLDDVSLKGAEGRELVVDGGFERADGSWEARGTHETSQPIDPGESVGGRVMRLVALGRGDGRHNHLAQDILRELEPGHRYELSFRAKWQRGSPLVLTRIAGQGVARTQALEVPERLGSPGRANTVAEASPPPAVGVPEQRPVAPSAVDPVHVRARISSLAPLVRAAIVYRSSREPEWREAPMALRAGAFEGSIPPLPPGRVEFWIRAVDVDGRQGAYPQDAPTRVAQYAVGLEPRDRFPHLTLLVTDSEWQALHDRPRMSNRLSDATLVYGTERIFYNVGFRRRGSPWTRGRDNWRIVFGEDDLDGRTKLTIDGQGGDGRRLSERLTYWFLERLDAPGSRQRWVALDIAGRESGVYEDVEKVDRAYVDRWFESNDRLPSHEAAGVGAEEVAPLHKIDDWFELFRWGGREYVQAYLRYRSEDPEAYRYMFPPRGNAFAEDFGPLLELIRFMDPGITDDEEFERRLEEVIDADTWLKVLAVRTLVDDWDTFGRNRGKNAYLYRSPRDGRWRLLPWDCDLSWRDPYRSIESGRFPSIQRLLEVPRCRRVWLGYLWHLARNEMDPERFDVVLRDLERRGDAWTGSYRDFASTRRDALPREIPEIEFEVTSVRREPRAETPDELVVEGTGPVSVLRARLGAREARLEALDLERWRARVSVGPGGGRETLFALDYGGGEVARAVLGVPPRPGARELDDDTSSELRPAGAWVGGVAGVGEEAARPTALAGGESSEGVELELRGEVVKVSREREADEVERDDGDWLRPTRRPGEGRLRLEHRPSVLERAGWALAVLGGALLIVLAGLFAVRRRLSASKVGRRGAESPNADSSHADSPEAVRARLLSPDPDEVIRELRRLRTSGLGAVPLLLPLLEDERRTSLHRLRRSGARLTGEAAPADAGVPLRRLATALLALTLGRPEVDRPTRDTWETLWRRRIDGES